MAIRGRLGIVNDIVVTTQGELLMNITRLPIVSIDSRLDYVGSAGAIPTAAPWAFGEGSGRFLGIWWD